MQSNSLEELSENQKVRADRNLPRVNLLKKFQENLDRRLIIIEAPAGYGKSTLIQEWINYLESIDQSTVLIQAGLFASPPFSFQEQIFLNIKEKLSDFSKTNENISRKIEIERTSLISPILKILNNYSNNIFIFIDDMHECNLTEINFFQQLFYNTSEKVHFIVGTREPLPISITKLRVNQSVFDIGIDDLRLSRAEVKNYLQNSSLSDNIDYMYEYTEGWIIALKLLKNSNISNLPLNLEKLGIKTRQSEISRYLNEHFFDRLEPKLQTFLIETAHLGTLNGDIANQIRSADDSWQILADLTKKHSLIFELAGAEISYRYHQLLREYLTHRQQSLGSKKLIDIYRKTSEWYFSKNWISLAIKYSLLANDSSRAIEILENAGCVRIGMEKGAPQLAECLEQFPFNIIHSTPRLIIAKAYLLLKNARFDEAKLYLKEAKNIIEPNDKKTWQELIMVEAHLRTYEDQDLSEAQLAALEFTSNEIPINDGMMRGLFSNFLCYFNLKFGNLDKAQKYGEAALANFLDLKLLHLQFFMYLHLSMIDLDRGNYAEAKQKRQLAVDLAYNHFSHDYALCALADIYMCEIQFEIKNFDGIEIKLTRALDLASKAEGWNEAFLSGYETCIKLCFLQRGYEAATNLFNEAETNALRRSSIRLHKNLRILELELAIDANKKSDIDRLLIQISTMLNQSGVEEQLTWRERILAQLAVARAYVYNDNLGMPDEILNEALSYCIRFNLRRYILRIYVLKLIIAEKSSDWDFAYKSIKSLIHYSSKDFIGAMLRHASEFTSSIQICLRNIGIGKFSPDETNRLSQILWLCSGSDINAQSDILNQILTTKENTVIRLIAQGKSNKVIAKEMDLSDATVKFHLKNIFMKLGVRSRRLVAEIARMHSVSA